MNCIVIKNNPQTWNFLYTTLFKNPSCVCISFTNKDDSVYLQDTFKMPCSSHCTGSRSRCEIFKELLVASIVGVPLTWVPDCIDGFTNGLPVVADTRLLFKAFCGKGTRRTAGSDVLALAGASQKQCTL